MRGSAPAIVLEVPAIVLRALRGDCRHGKSSDSAPRQQRHCTAAGSGQRAAAAMAIFAASCSAFWAPIIWQYALEPKTEEAASPLLAGARDGSSQASHGDCGRDNMPSSRPRHNTRAQGCSARTVACRTTPAVPGLRISPRCGMARGAWCWRQGPRARAHRAKAWHTYTLPGL